MLDVILDALSDIAPQWRVFFLSMIPVGELRVSLPLGVAWGLPLSSAFFWSVAGNFVPVLPLLLILRRLLSWAARHPWWNNLLQRLAGENHRAQVRRSGLIGLALLVAVPLPGTGVWSGSLIASLLSLPLLPALAAVTIGMVLAGIAVALVTAGAVALSSLMWGEYLLIAIVVAALLIWLIRRR